jgi:hypothetical protein
MDLAEGEDGIDGGTKVTGFDFPGRTQKCTLCGKRPENCRCKCGWCGEPKWSLKNNYWEHHKCHKVSQFYGRNGAVRGL